MFEDNENVYLLKKNDGESNKYYFMKSNFIWWTRKLLFGRLADATGLWQTTKAERWCRL